MFLIQSTNSQNFPVVILQIPSVRQNHREISIRADQEEHLKLNWRRGQLILNKYQKASPVILPDYLLLHDKTIPAVYSHRILRVSSFFHSHFPGSAYRWEARPCPRLNPAVSSRFQLVVPDDSVFISDPAHIRTDITKYHCIRSNPAHGGFKSMPVIHHVFSHWAPLHWHHPTRIQRTVRNYEPLLSSYS